MSYQDIPGWMSFEEIYRQAVREAPQTGARFVELGSAFGRSAAFMCEEIVKSGKRIEFHCVDAWETKGAYQTFWNNLREHKRATDFLLVFHKMFTAASAVEFAAQELDFDFVFIDADHSYEGVKADIEGFLPLVMPGGIIAGDDYSVPDYPGVVRAVDEAFGDKVERRVGPNGYPHWFVRVPS
jgi:predicted O-methyltransferase YrrM